MAERGKRPSSKGTLYDEAKVGKVIDDRRIELGLEVKAVCDEMGWDKTEYSRKTHGKTPIWPAEHAKLHRILKGWTGFPFVAQTEGTVLDALKHRLPEILEYLASRPAPLHPERPGTTYRVEEPVRPPVVHEPGPYDALPPTPRARRRRR